MIKKMFARWAFTKEVRASIAQTLDKLSWMGLAVFTAAGLAMHSWAVAIATALWFALFQVLAHVVLGLAYQEEKARPASGDTPNPHSRLATPSEGDRAPPA